MKGRHVQSVGQLELKAVKVIQLVVLTAIEVRAKAPYRNPSSVLCDPLRVLTNNVMIFLTKLDSKGPLGGRG